MAHNNNIPLQELILTLDQATSMARQLPTTSDPTQLHQIYSTLHHAHHNLSTFLAAPPPRTHPSAENSHSSATAADPMQVGDGGEEEPEANSRNTAVDMVEEGIRNCFIRNKRSKRRLSPTSAADDVAPREGSGGASGNVGFDPLATRRRALDLVYQFYS